METIEGLATDFTFSWSFAGVATHVGSEDTAIPTRSPANFTDARHASSMANIVGRQLLLGIECGFALRFLALVWLDATVTLSMAHHVARLGKRFATNITIDSRMLPAMTT